MAVRFKAKPGNKKRCAEGRTVFLRFYSLFANLVVNFVVEFCDEFIKSNCAEVAFFS